jgi:hypothetical protein
MIPSGIPAGKEIEYFKAGGKGEKAKGGKGIEKMRF